MFWSFNKEKRDEQRYIDALRAKFANRSRSELIGIYNDLLRLKKCLDNSAVAEKKEAYAKSRDEQLSLLTTQIAATMVQEEIAMKYPFSISSKYLHHDIAYLRNLI